MKPIIKDINLAKKIKNSYDWNDEQSTLHLLLSTSISEITTFIRKTKARTMDEAVIVTMVFRYIFFDEL